LGAQVATAQNGGFWPGQTISDGDLVAVRCPASPKESFWLATVKKQAKSKTTICWCASGPGARPPAATDGLFSR
jgi:hypothetical protein